MDLLNHNVFFTKMISEMYKVSKENAMADAESSQLDWQLLLKIDYAFHSNDNDYDNGLSFIDRLYAKLCNPFNLQWNVDELKDSIRNSNDSEYVYLQTIERILTQEMVEFYGV